MIKELEVDQIRYITKPNDTNLCFGCAAYNDLGLCDSLGEICVDQKIIWVVGISVESVKDTLRRVRSLVAGLTKTTDMPSGEDLQPLQDIDKALAD